MTIDPVTAGGAVPSRAQVVIVGGGVTGCSIAYHLAHLGWTDVVLLEQHQLTAGTTWHAAGLITSAGMTDETALFFSRYSRDLYARLEQETGHSTGFRPVGHISLATSPRRQEALRREAAWMHGFGVQDVEISPRELADMWPLARTDDVLSAFYVADEGRADPVGVATSLAKGARQLGVRVVEGVTATGVQTRGRQVTAVLTSAGRIETEVVVNAAGMWARQFGALAGVGVPLQAAEHYYLLTDTVPGMDPDLPVIEDPDNYGYYRPEGDGMLVGLFEPVAAPWSLDGVPSGFSFGKISPDWERMEPFLGPALDRIPVLAETGVRTFFCGPESFTADVRPLLGPAPELDGYFVAAGLNSLGILSGGGVGSMLAHWIVDGVPPVDATSVAIDRTHGYETSRRFRAERTVEQLGVLFGDAVWPAWKPLTGRNVRRSVLHDRLAAAGGHFAASAGWEFAEWYASGPQTPAPGLDPARLGWGRPAAHQVVGREHAAVREAVGLLDMSLMAKFLVQGPGAAAVLSRLSANDVTAGLGRLVYTQWLNEAGGIVADVTVTSLEPEKFLVIASDIIHRRIEPLIRRATRPGEFLAVTDVTSGTTLLSVQGPASRTLIGRLTDADLSNEAFPYLSARQIHTGYAPVLAIRVTYVGELGWELHVVRGRGGAQPGAGGDRRRRGDRLQHRLSPRAPGLDRRGAARAAPADRRDDVARGRADHLGRDDGRDRAVLQPVLTGPVRPAGAGDRALHRVPPGRAHLPGHQPAPAGGAAPRGGLDALASGSRTQRSRRASWRTCGRWPAPTTCCPRSTSPTRGGPTRWAWPPRWPREPGSWGSGSWRG